MASVTLHRVSRLIEAVTRALKAAEPRASAKLSVFAPDVASELATRQAECTQAVDTTIRLLTVRAELRAVAARTNAACGISDLLAEKAAQEDLIAVLERLPGVAPQAKAEPEDEYGYRRRNKKPAIPAVLDAATTLAAAQAARIRYEAAAGEVTDEMEVSLVDAETARGLRRRVAEARRRLDTVADQLRALNAAQKVEVSQDTMDWLTANDVV